MSKVGKVPIAIPDGVKVTVGRDTFSVEGKFGRLEQAFRPDMVQIAVDDAEATVTRRKDGKEHRAYHGLYRSLLSNMVHGVSERWEKTLLVRGLGYRARLQGTTLVLDLGYSNPMEYEIPQGVEVEVPNPNEIVVRGADRQLVGQVSANIRKFRKPNVYDGKGIRYKNEQVIQKAGKLGGPGSG
jgi:large subunit ribosomal protein L6